MLVWYKTMELLYFVIFAATYLYGVANGQLSPFGGNCRVENRISDLRPCLSQIYNLAQNNTAFWFGNTLENRCDETAMRNPYDWNCYVGLEDSPRERSIFDRLFTSSTGVTGLDRYLTVTYSSAEGNYSACGGTFTMPRRTLDAQPDLPAVAPWFVRNQPFFNFQADPDTQYWIMIFDGAFGSVLGMYSGYPLPRTEYQYQPPINARNVTTPIVFLVFKDNNPSRGLSARWRTAIQTSATSRKAFDLSAFVREMQLDGPIGMNILMLGKDPYSADELKRRNGPDFCSKFVGDALSRKDETFIQRMDFGFMDRLLTLTFTSTPATFSVCCKNYQFGSLSLTANPLSDSPIDPIMTREPPILSIVSTTNQSPNSDRLYTIIAVDPTIPKNALSTTNRPFLQWLVVNVPENRFADFTDEMVVLKYMPTVPAPQSPPHTIYFFLFEQQGRIATKGITEKYSDTLCIDYLFGRCLFQITEFIRDNQLILRAANWINLVNDAYARYWLIKSGQVEWDICAGQPGYQVPCPRPGEIQVARPPRVTEAGASSLQFNVLLVTCILCWLVLV